MIPFIKAEALKNDFVIVDMNSLPNALSLFDFAKNISNRRTGIGCDQLIIISHKNDKEIRVRFFNADGSEAENCGNGCRAVGLYWMDKIQSDSILIHTKAGCFKIKKIDINLIELLYPLPSLTTLTMDSLTDSLHERNDLKLICPPTIVDVGNPHLVLFVDHEKNIELLAKNLGPTLENSSFFPNKINVNFAKLSPQCQHIDLCVYERGAGLTQACGTGALATATTATKNGFVSPDKPIVVHQKGGDLCMKFKDEILSQIGPARVVFEGLYLLN
jgi:diaminopimelate epimerase